jgi:hypothetical protein
MGGLSAHLHPLHEDTEAYKQGRARKAPLPPEYHWLLLTQQINALTGASYTVEQVRFMPSDDLLLFETYFAVKANPTIADDEWEPPTD